MKRVVMLSFCVIVGLCLHGQTLFNLQCLSLSNHKPDADSSRIDSFFLVRSIDLRATDKMDLYVEIYRWYKTCYKYGGNSGKGIDCSHFVNMLYEKIYDKKLNGSSASIFTQCKALKGGIKKAREGDLLFFKIRNKRISHVGLYLQNGLFVHATTQAGVIISDLNEAYYKKYFFKAGRIQ